ncbi:endonuclease/exonuclease/phosphatase family protein [Paenibacillus sp. OAS669]|uniref:endonuclease/exonuclease/phosphatase family protein n=1 Tax=Paenibacillus sp. OAS669 TaxID=2663821 RepID=UPI00178A45C1|nr:endonuclease/exonuclease/phosphatase family protein [Paenibacillus sp. OAS669]MBE1443028.1 endonuclease/exonuclease/phosphatase family metal-dependent hydrolase [Paenibacillus sp. OAS669]
MIIKAKITAFAVLLTAVGLTIAGNQASAAAGDEELSSGKLRIMTSNLRTASAVDDQPWEKRRPVMKQLIEAAKPDVIGTQEGIDRQIKDLEADLPDYGWIGVGREGGNLGEYMAIFYNKQRLKPLEQDHFWLSDRPKLISSVGWGNRIPRMVTWVRFQDMHNLKTFYMVNTHLDHESEAARQKSAQLIADTISSLDPDVPVILTGDFNTTPDGAVYQTLVQSGLMEDAFFQAHQKIHDDLGTFHNYKDPTGGGGAKRIDWILSRGKVNVVRSETVTYQQDGQYPSDHYPVTVDLVLQKASKSVDETTVKQPAKSALLITEVVPNSTKGNYNYVEVVNNSDRDIDLDGYKLYYYYDPLLPFDKAKSNKWTIQKDTYSTSSIIKPGEAKVIWIKKQPCCYSLGIDSFRDHYGLTAADLKEDQLLAVFTPGDNQGLNGTATTGRALGIMSPDGAQQAGVQYNLGVLDVQSNEAVTYTAPAPFISIMQKLGSHQRATPGILAEGQLAGK